MTNVQPYFAIGIPTFTVLCSLMVGIFQLNHSVNQINLRFTSLENRIGTFESRVESRMNLLEADLKTVVRVINELAFRIARLEERTAR